MQKFCLVVIRYLKNFKLYSPFSSGKNTGYDIMLVAAGDNFDIEDYKWVQF